MPDADALAAIVVPIMIFGIPIVAILAKHQQKMAELIHQNRQPQANAEMEQMRREMYELKQIVHQQAIQMDSLIAQQRELMGSATNASLSNRMENM